MIGGAVKSSLPLPLLRWAGSKRKLIPQLLRNVPLVYNTYVEPFAGSACLFFAARPSTAILGDKNEELVATYKTLRSHPLLTYRALATLPTDRSSYYRIRDDEPPTLDPIPTAARFIYLNRHCFNGVYRTNRSGRFNVPYGSRLGVIPSQTQFLRCAIALRSAELRSDDFALVSASAEEGDFLYLDPPYAKRGARDRGEYGCSSFSVSDIERLSVVLERAHQRGVTFLLSYENCPEIEDIQRRWHSVGVSVRRHVAGFSQHRGIASELFISNRRLSLT